MRASEFINEAYYNKNAHYIDDRSINPATGKPYIQFRDLTPLDADTNYYPNVYPSYKVAQRSLNGYKNKDNLKIVRAGVSKFKIVPSSDPAPELLGE